MKNNTSASKSKAKEELQILVVDDDPIIRMLHQRIVQSAAPGLSVYACKNGEEAVNHLIASRAGTRFLVLLDINMPVMNGWEFLQHCQKKKFENIVVMMVSSSVNISDRKRAATFPQVFRYCEKPLNKNFLAELILQIKRRIFSGSS